jgi:protein-S-isoprenylcysteine O-methyltransferase Ste14
LVTDGPYGYVRHPLYVGSFLIGLGLCVIAGSVPLTVVFGLCFWLSHTAAIRSEEATLERQWPEDFTQYRTQVHALWPRRNVLGGHSRLWPRRPWEALGREADAICLWLLAAIALEFWENALVDYSLLHHRVEAGLLTTLAVGVGLGWRYLRTRTLKRSAGNELALP